MRLHFWLLPLLITLHISVASAKRESKQAYDPKRTCQRIHYDPNCGIASVGSPALQAIVRQCEMTLAANNCQAFAEQNPQALASGKLKSCNEISNCPWPENLTTAINSCASGLKAWKDTADFVWKFINGEAGLPSAQSLAQLDYFKNCTSADCKRQMLGDFSGYFTKEEIEGKSGAQELSAEDLANGNLRQGYSAAVLYRKLLLKLKDQIPNKTMDDKFSSVFVQPWSGQEAHAPLSMNEMIERALDQAGITNTACYRPEVVTEMRCYALLTILDPSLAVAATVKMGSVAGIIRRAAVLTKENAQFDRATQVARAANKLPEFADAQGQIWKLHQSGNILAAANLEGRVRKSLTSIKIIYSEPITSGSASGARYVVMDDGVQGIWKPARTSYGDLKGEIATQRIDQFLGTNTVPVTVERELEGIKGSLQLRVVNLRKISKAPDYPVATGTIDYLVGNFDRHGNNYLMTKDGQLVAIDNGQAFVGANFSYTETVERRTWPIEKNLIRQSALRDKLKILEKEKNAGTNSAGIEQRKAQIDKELEELQRKHKVDTVTYAQELAPLFQDRKVVERLSQTTRADWKKILGDSVTSQQLDDMMVRQKEIVAAAKKAEKYLGNSVYSAGPATPIRLQPLRTSH